MAEKPSVARDLARVLGVRASTGQSCFEGDGKVITWCVGHLVELDEPVSYNPLWKAWRLDALPMLPSEFRLRPSKHAADQLRAVTRLLGDRRFTQVVNACDAGREGELIFRYVYQYAGSRLPVRRLWISSLTDDAIRRGFAQLRPGDQLDALGDAARSRSEADWLVGMNATRAITARGREAGHSALYSIGRVQTPTLAMLVAREQAIRAFVPRDYWEVRADLATEAGERFSAGWRHHTKLGKVARLGAAALAEAIVERDRAVPHAVVEQLQARTTREPPPLLFDLTSLQRTANKRFGFSAQRTLEIAQALYERHKVLTYPRTDSRHLTTDVAGELPGLFAALAELPDYAEFAAPLVAEPPRPGRRVIDDAKVHDHHAIIPTGKARLDALDRDERRIFDLVVRRFLGAFYPDAEFAITEAWIRVGASEGAKLGFDGRPVVVGGENDGEVPILTVLPPPPDRYLARGRVRIAAGWQAVAGIEPARGDNEEATLPVLVEGQQLAGAYAAIAKQTKPPPRFTEATLLGAMESAGKSIDDEALRAAMKDVGLGTPATRASIIETLLRREYIARERQQLVPTELGIGLIATLPVASLASPELTGAWEARLARIARGEESRTKFMADIARYVADMIEAVRGSPVTPIAPASGPVGRCPRCRGEVVDQARAYACTGTCGFAIVKKLAGHVLAVEVIRALLAGGRSPLVRGFRSKKGKAFAAVLVLDEQHEVRFEFAPREAKRTPASGKRGSKRRDRTPREHAPRERAPRERARSTRHASSPSESPSRMATPVPSSYGDSMVDAATQTYTRDASGDAMNAASAVSALSSLLARSRGSPSPPPPVALLAQSRGTPPPVEAPLACPRCSGTLITGARGW
ncbi:MAG: DNA topoisomerase, partial [Kofleriaceae bacterium]